jgi:hypothetical protein
VRDLVFNVINFEAEVFSLIQNQSDLIVGQSFRSNGITAEVIVNSDGRLFDDLNSITEGRDLTVVVRVSDTFYD